MRPGSAVTAVGAALVLAVAGCGSGQATEGESSPRGGGGYPLAVETLHGDVTIERAPERVMALGFAPADELLSLGIEPIAVAMGSGTLEEGAPWLVEDAAGIADAGLVPDGAQPDLEAIAAAEPDLIIAEAHQVQDEAVFDRLNAVAPVVAPATDSLNPDWDLRLRTTAAAVGRTDEAEALITAVTDEFAAIGAAVPGIEERTYQWVRADPEGYAFGNGSMFELFGLRPAENQDNTQTAPPLSKENTADLDADLLAVWPQSDGQRERLTEDPLFRDLPAARDGTVYYSDLAFANAINSPAPLSLRWVQQELTPVIERLG